MARTLDHDRQDVEFSVGPHPARPGWRVLRVSYAPRAEHEQRIARALAALSVPDETTDPESGEAPARPGARMAAAVAP